jgi:hypothetical protein
MSAADMLFNPKKLMNGMLAVEIDDEMATTYMFVKVEVRPVR